ncbi:MAG: recombinase family protein, partial [Bacteroidales bacterium]
MKAAIYIRVSTQLQSTDRQRTELTEYANKQGYQVVNIYEDYCSGFKDRVSYNQLKADATKGLFDIVLFSEMSRMTRKNILLSEVDYFKGNNVQVYFQKQNILVTNKKNDLGTSILLSVMSAISSYEVELMKERTTSGKIEKYKSKPFRVGNLSFGYYSDSDSTIHVDESKRQTVIDLFTKYAEGWRTSDIVEWLNIEVPEKTWHSYEIVRILKRDIYRGDQVVNIGGQNLSRYHDSLRIISDELSDRVIAQMDKNKLKSRNVVHNYILNDLIFCPCCGRTLRGRVSNKHQHYVCAGNNRFHRESGKGCDAKLSIIQHQIEGIAWHAVKYLSVKQTNQIDSQL